jgi:DNA-directed RNA polymerase III subunit RPC4
MIKPTFTGRRSKEERAALEREAIEREKARTKEREDADRRKRNDAERKAKRDAERAVRGRGGYNGAMSGPFSLGSSREGTVASSDDDEPSLTEPADRKTSHRNSSGFGAGSGSRATRIKNEGEGGGGGSGYRASGGGGSSIKREGGGSDSSEDEEDAEFPRKDIDYIEISSDDDEAAPTQRPQRSTLPVRIGRKEHQDRSFGKHTETNTEPSAIVQEVAEASGHAPTAGASRLASSKGKGKAKEVDAASSNKTFKGVWQDPEELASPLKTEDNSEEEQMAHAEQIGIVEQPDQLVERQEPPPEAEPRSKARIKGIAEPVLQTDEDRAEWQRFTNNLHHIRAELGPDQSAAADASGDANMTEAANNARNATVRDNNVYLFQIPPLMPELLPTSVKKEPLDAPGPSTASVSATPGKAEVKIKVEETFTDAFDTGHEAPRFASGSVGKLRVRQSGRTTLDWGGTSYVLEPGNKISFLQEVVSLHVVPEKERVVPEDAGEAVSFGRVKGKFVVVPDWDEML